MLVMKFGGTSVGNAERIGTVAKLVKSNQASRPVVVTSAMTQITNQLEEMARLATAQNRKRAIAAKLSALKTVHEEAIAGLKLEPTAEADLREIIQQKIAILDNILKSVTSLGELTPRGRDLILSFGERLSVHLVAAALNREGVPAVAVNATDYLITDDNFTDAQPLFTLSKKKAQKLLVPLIENGTVPVVTGFIGATRDGVTTTLGRGGSDFSATILGYCLDAKEVWIWTDVDGVMTSDPRIVPHARSIACMSYEEASELSYFGAKVIHPRTMTPTAELGIPIVIKNTMNPDHPGTRITPKGDSTATGARALTLMKNLAMITIQGKGMRGVYGVAARVFDTLAVAHVSVLFISQASSENNITIVVEKTDGQVAARALRQAFAAAIRNKRVDLVEYHSGVSLIAVVGAGMRHHVGIAGKIFTALGDRQINVAAIAQGSSELNITLVVESDADTKALQCIHNALFTAKNTKGNRL
ncbi:aspartate kinase [Candidatus Saccharibacteria bacterium]|nr:MAG: aspartate kinase [Candidatus Saccharibacteria bacterium]